MEPLLIKHIVERAAACFPRREIVARTAGEGRFAYTYADFYRRIQRTAHVLDGLGAGRGGRAGHGIAGSWCSDGLEMFEGLEAVEAAV